MSTPQYASASAQQAIFDQINTQRQACGFPALTENTLLDQASQAHADYIGKNGGTITDDEVSGNPGFSGATYADRATHVGYPASSVVTAGESAGYYTNATLSEAAYGANIATAWSSGVYHVAAFVWPVTQIGVGWNETTYNGFPEAHGVITVTNLQPMSGSLPTMFPCEGATGVPYKVVGETPAAPNTSGAWGPAVALGANSGDTIALTSATLTDTSGNVINLQLLNSTNDPNKLIQAFEAVAYPATPLSPNTKYSAVVSGTINGTPFTRTRTFTTGS
ncbi:CAP domain-containing protein [Paraburkholderia sp. CNPSo 3272]|uniref:CAP domain-containing protein n=1 Tax=Paraburkholderia sp. CNPSo 3272 TaxID=2940931 RepID=UPI002814A108|nr:CAP domain-containing protein [Paraburkholderia sp. CNPSo 3272]